MTDLSSAQFFSDLPVHRVTLSQLLGDTDRFAAVPADWHVIVTDIKNSTAAVQAGQHETVNLIATGSIIATLNLAYGADLLVPFFFGGDGAILIVPPALLEPALAALATHRANTRDNFGLVLRVGAVPVADLYAARHRLTISRLYLSDLFSIPIVLGEGLAEAERLVKGYEGPDTFSPGDLLDLQGMQCRWNRIEPDVPAHEVVSLLVTTPAGQPQAPAFKRVVDLLDAVYGSPDARNPVSPSRLRLNSTMAKLTNEVRTRLGRLSVWDLARTWLVTQVGRLYFVRSPNGKTYLEQLVDLTDTLVIDGRISTVIAGTDRQRRQLEAGLDRMEREGLITYGLAVSSESVMSCYVRDYTDKHIHFVDGADGGYTLAATVLKRKRLAATTPGGADDESL